MLCSRQVNKVGKEGGGIIGLCGSSSVCVYVIKYSGAVAVTLLHTHSRKQSYSLGSSLYSIASSTLCPAADDVGLRAASDHTLLDTQ